jgi:hypothetical protein
VPETFTPYRDRPALDKGPRISWVDLESGMLFRPGAGEPSLRRVRGIPQFIWYGATKTPSFMIGSEDEVDGRPCGGVIGDGGEFYTRSYLDDGRAVYTSNIELGESNEEIIERLRTELTRHFDILRANPDADARRLRIAEENLVKLKERRNTHA